MKYRRNFVWAPWVIWTIVLSVAAGAGGGVAYYLHWRDKEDEAVERAEKQKKVRDAASYIGLAGLGLGIGALAVKGGQAPPRMRGF